MPGQSLDLAALFSLERLPRRRGFPGVVALHALFASRTPLHCE